MSVDPVTLPSLDWRQELPTLATGLVCLREPIPTDLGSLHELLARPDASRFGLDEPTRSNVQSLIARAPSDRAAGRAVTYTIELAATGETAGLFQVRGMDPAFEIAEWECTLAPSARGTGAFLEAARLVGSLVFDTIGANRLEARVLAQNGRACGALRKLGAVHEGILRRSLRRNGQYLDQSLWSLLRDDWGGAVPSRARVH
jgi:RimJ/RimL family protein N-acetyltransferase